MMRKENKILRCLYCFGMAIVAIWLCISTSLIARMVNGTYFKKVNFESVRKMYLKDYIYYNLSSNVDYITYDGDLLETLTVSGWAFCDTTEDYTGRHALLILKSPRCTYEIPLYTGGRFDVPIDMRRRLNRPDMKIAPNTGIVRNCSLLEIEDGVYDIYLCCWENETNHGMSDLFYQLTKKGSDVQITPWRTSALEEQVQATQEEESLGYLDGVTIKDDLVSVYGWEFIPDKDTVGQSVYVELTDSNGNTAQYPSKMKSRSDVAKAYENQIYAQSGYMTTFAKDSLQDGVSTVRVFVQNDGTVSRSKQYSIIRDGDEITVQQR